MATRSEPGGDTVTCAASLTGKNGRIRVLLPRAMPASAVVRIAGQSINASQLVAREQEGEGWVADVEVISPSMPLPQRAAAWQQPRREPPSLPSLDEAQDGKRPSSGC